MANVYQDIEIILRAELNKFREVGRGSGGLGSMVVRHEGRDHYGPPAEWRTLGDAKARAIVLNAEPGAVHSDHVETLARLYSSLADDWERRHFKETLVRHLHKDSPYKEIAYFCVWGLHIAGDLSWALLVATSLRDAGGYVIDDILRLLGTFLQFEWKSFTVKDLDAIEEFTKRVPSHDHRRLLERLAEARLEHLRGRLEGVNPEINEDRDKALRLWSDEFQSPELEKMVRQIEDMFAGGSMDATHFATCMDRIRALIVEVSRRVGKKIEELTGKKFKGEWDNEQAVFAYLARGDVAFLSDREKGLIINIYGLCSEHGAHSIIAEKEYARLTKNMTYELFLLFMEKFQKFRAAVK